jgi:excisionase family DNA binding protein
MTLHNRRVVERQTITSEETAEVLGIHRNTAYRAAKCGESPAIRVGGKLLVPQAVLIRILTGDTGHATLHRQGGQLISAQ